MANVPTSNLTALYNNTTPSTTADPAAMDNAIIDIVSTINGNSDNVNALISAGTLSRLGIINVKDYNASGLATTATGSITSGTKILTLTATPDFVAGQGINLQGAIEVASLLVTAAATVSSNVTVTLNGVAFLVAVLNGDTTSGVATKIRAATYAGWTTGGTGDTVTFTSTTSGVKTDATYSAGTTGATATMTTTTQGTADQISTVSSVQGLVVNIADNSTRTITAGTIKHDDTVACQAALSLGGYIVFPNGTYNISDCTSKKGLKPVSNSIIMGCGNTIIKLAASVCNGFSNYIDDFTTPGFLTLSNVRIENLIFDGDYNNIADPGLSIANGDNYGFGVYIVRATNIQVVNCRFYRHWYGGANLFVVDRPHYEDNYFEDCCNNTNFFAANYAAFGADSGTHSKIINNHVYNCAAGFRAAGNLANAAVTASESWEFSGNLFDGTYDGIQMYLGMWQDINVHHNKFLNVGYRAIAISGGGSAYSRDSSVKKIVIDHNIILSNDTFPSSQGIIYAQSVDSIDITNNTIEVTTNSASSDIIVCSSEYNGSIEVYPYQCVIQGNKIKCGNIRYVMNLQGTFIISDNIVNAGAVTYVVWGNSNTTHTLHHNKFTITSGSNLILTGITALSSSLSANWTDYDAATQTASGYYNDNGTVYLRGLIKKSIAVVPNETIFNLPTGSRPLKIAWFVVATDTGIGVVRVNNNGSVWAISGGNGYFSLDGIYFRTDI